MRRPLCLLAQSVVLGSIGIIQPGARPGDGSFPILFTNDLDIRAASGVEP